MSRRGHWPSGRRRKTIDASAFITCVVRQYGLRPAARMARVDPRTLCRWRTGEHWCHETDLAALIDAICSHSGSLPLYSPEMAIDANTRVGGVGSCTLRAAANNVTLEDFQDDDD